MFIRQRLEQYWQGFTALIEYWKNQSKTLSHYWAIYGGWRALFLSPYVHISLVLTAACSYLNTRPLSAADVTVGVIPNLLGFTVGALAIVLAFSSADIFETLAQKGKPKSFFMTLTANLIHFMLIQVIALVLGIFTKLSGKSYLEIPTLFFLFYAVTATFAAGIQLFLTAIIYNTKASLDAKKNGGDGKAS